MNFSTPVILMVLSNIHRVWKNATADLDFQRPRKKTNGQRPNAWLAVQIDSHGF
jgi:hypothetical protein